MYILPSGKRCEKAKKCSHKLRRKTRRVQKEILEEIGMHIYLWLSYAVVKDYRGLFEGRHRPNHPVSYKRTDHAASVDLNQYSTSGLGSSEGYDTFENSVRDFKSP